MLFEQLPTGVIAAVLVVSCAVKHVAIRRLIYTRWYRESMQRPHWLFALAVMCLVSGTLMGWVFDRFAPWPTSLYIGLTDSLLHVLSGVYVKYSNLLEEETPRTRQVVTVLRIIHASIYLSFIWLTLR